MKRTLLTALALLFAAGFVALGVWQVERRAWKHDLIAAVDARIHTAPVAAPGPAAWPDISADKDAYRRVRASGRLRHDRSVLVKAVTDRGGGYWVVTPLETPAFTVLVNRGFVPQDKRDAASRPAGRVIVTGLLRINEPGGAFLRANDPAAGRWYSRDVAAIAKAKGLGRVAPYFVDADAAPNSGGYPVGGLTVVRFPDNHLVYALTWFALALLCLFFAWRLWRPAPLRSNIGAQ
ncbi:SURF1 family protein [Sphingopyxis indica]|uniref:SURF1 family protein n=1 Tax=Sphingopyxis indica TaxID=436663 RepID=UPI002938E460|nr:SURF1 family protein [Sphingopyxis indica]WOF44598.1 SURF1 family protein [Sphingopyxis indica]